MLYLIYGKDFKKNRQKLNSLVDNLQKRRPEAGIFKITDEDFADASSGDSRLQELVSSQGLFGGNYIVVCDHIFDLAEDLVKKFISEMNSSDHIFIFIEDELSKPVVKLFEKAGSKVVLHQKDTPKEKAFNVFALADAFCSKDKKEAWQTYAQSLKEGVPAEQSLGLIYWQLKNVWLVKTSDSTKDLGLKPFVFNKARRFGEKWSDKELKAMSHRLVSVQHESRLGGESVELALENVILSV